MLNPRSTFSLAATVALLTVIAPSQPFSRSTVMAAPAVFEVPTSVPDNTSLRVSSGSDAMTLISDVLKADFEGKFDGTAVDVNAVGADQAIQSLTDGESDLAAISRPLRDEEKAQDLSAVDVNRIKIAVIVGEDNPFVEGLTTEQFAQIFRGEITDWSEIGGSSGAIRLVDRPDTSDTRLALAPYPVFQVAEFASGIGAVQLDTDSTEDIAKALGTDGISYGLISEVENLEGVRILPMHKTLPTDPRYPFSQPFSFIYKGEPSPAVAAFLGYAAGEPGQAVLTSANPLAGVVSAASNAVQGAADAAGDAAKGAANAAGDAAKGAADAAGTVVDGAVDAAGNAVNSATDTAGDAVQGAADASGSVVDGATAAANQVSDRNPRATSRGNLWWLMVIPAVCFGLVAWGARRNKDKTAYMTASGADVDGVKAAGARSATKKTGDFAKDGLGTAGKAAKSGLGSVKGGLDNAGDAVKDGLGNVGNAAKGGLGSVKGGLDNAGDAVKDGLGNVGNAAKGGLGSVKGGLDNADDAAKGGLGNIKGAAQQGVDGIKGGLGTAGNTVQDGADRIGQGIKGGLDSAGNAVKGGTDALSGMADDASNAVKDGATGSKSLWNRVRDGVGDAADSVADKTGDMANQAKRQADNLSNQASKLGQKGLDKASDAADKLADLDR